MGTIAALLARLSGQRVYIDTNIFIYFLDRHPEYFQVVKPIFDAVQIGAMSGVTGDAAVAEVMAGPYRSGAPATVAAVKAFFDPAGPLLVLSHGAEDFDLAAQLRATHAMKLVDALHVATASRAACRFLLTQDEGIRPFGGLEIVGIGGLAFPP